MLRRKIALERTMPQVTLRIALGAEDALDQPAAEFTFSR
jgi:hypothetical protein